MSDWFSTDAFMPHGYCLLWQPGLLLTHVVSDAVIALSYFSIPLVILLFRLRRRDVGYRRISLLFAAFVFGCGLTHVMGIITLWDPQYQIEGIFKAMTAVVSLWTAIELWPLLPQLVAVPKPSDLHAVNATLREEVAVREKAEEDLRQLNLNLEERVSLRTRDLQDAMEMLEQTNVERRNFLARFSHELRTPLNAIIGFSDAMIAGIGGTVESPRHREYLDHIRGAGQHLLQMISDILDMSRVESGSRDLRVEPVEVRQVVEECVATTAIMARSMNAEIRIEIDDAALQVPADRMAIKQILLNLLSNAIKYAASGGEIVVGATSTVEGGAVLSVSDRGPGMSAEDAARVLRPFVQGRALDPSRFGSTGLGLSICKGLAELHGGRLTIETSPGAGTRIQVFLPGHTPAGQSVDTDGPAATTA